MAQYVPEKHYVGFQDVSEDTPLVFLTPWGEDAAAKKRMETVDEWANGYHWSKSKNPACRVFENKPQTGFKISKHVRRWTTSNVVWRIEDPRGFELEISSGNLAYLMAECVFNKGEILEELCWVRDNAQNYLLPTRSEEYQKYTKTTAAIKNSVKMSDLNEGDLVSATTGEVGIYCGMVTVISRGFNYDDLISAGRRHVIKIVSDKKDNGNFVAKSAFKGVALIEKGKESGKDYVAEMNADLSKVQSSSWSGILGVVKRPVKVDEILKTVVEEPATDQDHFALFNYKDHRVAVYKDSETVAWNAINPYLAVNSTVWYDFGLNKRESQWAKAENTKTDRRSMGLYFCGRSRDHIDVDVVNEHLKNGNLYVYRATVDGLKINIVH